MKIMVLADEALASDTEHMVLRTARQYADLAIKLGYRGDIVIDYQYPVECLGQQINCDAVILDYGGMSFGATGFADWVSRRFAEAIRDYPNTQFFLVSEMYSYGVREEIQKWYDGTGFPHNYGIGWEAYYEWLNQQVKEQE